MKVRLKFSKAGSMKFIGHLDMMRFFQKAFRRADIRVAYSKGFSPHPILSFAAPLGVGLTSDGEYLDMQLDSLDNIDSLVKHLNLSINDEIRITDICILPETSKNAMSSVSAADYLVSLKDGYEKIDDFQNKFIEYGKQAQILISKKSKKSEKEVDIRPMIYAYAFTKEEFAEKIKTPIKHTVADSYENESKVYLQLSTGSVKNLKPELVMEGFYHFIHREWNPLSYQFHRIEIYGSLNQDNIAQTEGKDIKLVPLIEISGF